MSAKFPFAKLAPVLLGAAALTGCSGEGGESGDANADPGNDSSVEVAQAAGTSASSDARIKAGRWEVTSTWEKWANPGLTPQMQEAMKQKIGKPETLATCLAPKDGTSQDVDFFASQSMAGCTPEKQAMAGGKIEAISTCDVAGETKTVRATGTYAEGRYSVRTTVEGKSGGEPTVMVMMTDARHMGDCKGDELKLEMN